MTLPLEPPVLPAAAIEHRVQQVVLFRVVDALVHLVQQGAAAAMASMSVRASPEPLSPSETTEGVRLATQSRDATAGCC